MPFIIASVYSPRATLVPKLRDEEERLKTFKNWTSAFMKPSELAANGFYYTDFQDMARCAFCGVAIGYWKKGAQVAVRHKNYFPYCDFVRGRPCNNIPKATTSTPLVPTAAPPGSDTTGAFGLLRADSDLEHSTSLKETWGVNLTGGPRKPILSSFEARLVTFGRWPTYCPVQSQSLAAAGFYSEGNNETYCFSCGGGLRDWVPNDDPWFEHARFFPHCAFVNMVRGQDFVKRAGESGATALSVQMKTMQLDEQSSKASASDTGQVPATCIICISKRRTIVFLPCCHLVACATCASALSLCPSCWKPFNGTIRAYQ